ncbi:MULTISPECIES: DUF4424 family protein [unclassified Novosphingobium]|uniref:DUF4424 family protein n=1 Tax=unclassified Novosphingobium TaxID=2644732 RepID=UPI0025D3A7EE|nr:MULTISPECIES: DUF4424 family protein [unclassified Novosphingobium]HQV04320.1 DUF4424 family protein [Novosphingobium sp.]
MRLATVLLLSAAVLAFPAHANDSEAAINLGGIELVQNRDVSMDSEDLYIAKDEVRVRYRYTNHSARDLELTISFPLPPIKAADEELYGDQAVPDFTKLEFHTAVDGKPVKFQVMKRAEIKGRDVTQRLAQLGWPLEWITGSGDQPRFVGKLTAAEKAARVADGLLRKTENGDHFPTWDVVTHVTRKQVFPAGRTVEVTHRYAPMIGGSVAGSLLPGVREEFPGNIRQYCIDKAFLAAFDKKLAARKGDDSVPMAYSETWIGYVLSSGRNWRGPIKDFRLVVDKGKPENMVSFCMNGVKKISPTQFEVRRKNFEPKGDLEVLIVEWPSIED